VKYREARDDFQYAHLEMAKGKLSLSLTGLLVVFAIILVLGMMFFSRNSVISPFEDLNTCVLGLKPCDEGNFCNNGICTPVFPKINNSVNGYRQDVDLS